MIERRRLRASISSVMLENEFAINRREFASVDFISSNRSLGIKLVAAFGDFLGLRIVPTAEHQNRARASCRAQGRPGLAAFLEKFSVNHVACALGRRLRD